MSYLALAKEIEGRHEEYRQALNLYWQAPSGAAADHAYQRLLCLLDELGVLQATRVRQDEMNRWLTAS